MIWNSTTTPLTAGADQHQGLHPGRRPDHPGLDERHRCDDLHAAVHRPPEINATVEANDGLAEAVVTDLKNKGVGPKKIPTTGQDATLQGMENILQGYQCGSVYKAVYQEAQDAVTLATILRAGKTPPAALVNSTTTPPTGRDGHGAAGVAAHPGVGERRQHGVDGDQGQVHLGIDAVHGGGQRVSAPQPRITP